MKRLMLLLFLCLSVVAKSQNIEGVSNSEADASVVTMVEKYIENFESAVKKTPQDVLDLTLLENEVQKISLQVLGMTNESVYVATLKYIDKRAFAKPDAVFPLAMKLQLLWEKKYFPPTLDDFGNVVADDGKIMKKMNRYSSYSYLGAAGGVVLAFLPRIFRLIRFSMPLISMNAAKYTSEIMEEGAQMLPAPATVLELDPDLTEIEEKEFTNARINREVLSFAVGSAATGLGLAIMDKASDWDGTKRFNQKCSSLFRAVYMIGIDSGKLKRWADAARNGFSLRHVLTGAAIWGTSSVAVGSYYARKETKPVAKYFENIKALKEKIENYDEKMERFKRLTLSAQLFDEYHSLFLILQDPFVSAWTSALSSNKNLTSESKPRVNLKNFRRLYRLYLRDNLKGDDIRSIDSLVLSEVTLSEEALRNDFGLLLLEASAYFRKHDLPYKYISELWSYVQSFESETEGYQGETL